MSAPDFDRIRQLVDEANGLIASGAWTESEFRRLFDAAEKAADGDGEFCEPLLQLADSDWVLNLLGLTN
jgi:hypothetical protein